MQRSPQDVFIYSMGLRNIYPPSQQEADSSTTHTSLNLMADSAQAQTRKNKTWAQKKKIMAHSITDT